MQKRRHAQLGQGLLLVLAFLAIFLIVVWSSLTLASGAFLGSEAAQSDTRSTYALDAGVSYTIEWLKNHGGNLCSLGGAKPGALLLAYPGNSLTVTVTALVAGPGCTTAKPILNLTLRVTGTTKTIRAEASNPAGSWIIVWQSYQ